MAKRTEGERPPRRRALVPIGQHARAGAAKAATAPRSKHGEGHPATAMTEYDAIESIVLRAVAQYAQEHHLRFMDTTDYLKCFRERGWLNESAITL